MSKPAIINGHSWPYPVVPVLAGSVISARGGMFSWTALILALAGAVLLHSGANLAGRRAGREGTGGPPPAWLGEWGTFLVFGPLFVTGTALAHAGRLLPEALWASLPVGMLAAGAALAGNMPAAAGREAGTRTLAGLLGTKNSLRLFHFLAFAPYLFALSFGSVWPPVFCAASAPLAVRLKERADKGEFGRLARETSRFLAAWGLLFCGGIYFTY